MNVYIGHAEYVKKKKTLLKLSFWLLSGHLFNVRLLWQRL